MTLNQSRLVRLNDRPMDRKGEFVLYWMQMQRRFASNHSLDYAIRCAEELGKPLVVVIAMWLAGKVFRMGMLEYGKSIPFLDVVKNFKF